MDEALQVVIEMSERIGQGFAKDLEDVTPEEAAWRPLPEANSIDLIVRHLCIEAQWHRASLERGEPMPHELSDALQREIDSVPLEFERNRRAFEEAYAGFVAALRTMTLVALQQRTQEVYHGWPSRSPHLLGFHQAMHVSMHWGQVRTIRNLYLKTRGQKPRFFPDNPTFPKTEA